MEARANEQAMDFGNDVGRLYGTTSVWRHGKVQSQWRLFVRK
jgi:hypothetical protein